MEKKYIILAVVVIVAVVLAFFLWPKDCGYTYSDVLATQGNVDRWKDCECAGFKFNSCPTGGIGGLGRDDIKCIGTITKETCYRASGDLPNRVTETLDCSELWK
jgi:hypothetical protein